MSTTILTDEQPKLALTQVATFEVLEPRAAIQRLEVVMTLAKNPEALEVLQRLNRFNLPFSRKGDRLEAGVFQVGERCSLSNLDHEVAQRAAADVALSYALAMFEDRALLRSVGGSYGLPSVCVEPVKMGKKEFVISFGVKKRKRQPFIGLSLSKLLPAACGLKYCPIYVR